MPVLTERKYGVLQYFAEPVDFVIVGLAQMLLTNPDLLTHQALGVAVAGNIAHGEINAFFDDEFIPADIHHIDLVFVFEGRG